MHSFVNLTSFGNLASRFHQLHSTCLNKYTDTCSVLRTLRCTQPARRDNDIRHYSPLDQCHSPLCQNSCRFFGSSSLFPPYLQCILHGLLAESVYRLLLRFVLQTRYQIINIYNLRAHCFVKLFHLKRDTVDYTMYFLVSVI